MAIRSSARQRLRIALGFFIAATLPGFVLSLPFVASGMWSGGLIMVAFGLKITVLPTLLVALPIFLWLSWRGQLRLWWAVLAGGVAGASFSVSGMISWIWRFGAGKSLDEIWRGALAYTDPAPFIGIGMVCGLIGWLIAYGPRLAPRASSCR